MEDIGKKLYKSTALKQFKAVYLGTALFLLVNLALQTFADPVFKASFENSFSGLIRFHIQYPQDFLVYCLTILFPAIYYSFIRGIVFCERGMIINRGFPFFNRNVLYENISSYKVVHPKYLMAVRRSDIEEEFVFTVREIDRVIAIFDQHNIEGVLGKESMSKTMTVNKKLILIFIIVGLAMFFFQYFGGIGRLFR